MKLSELNPLLGSYRPADKSWEFSICCPKCRNRFSIRVSEAPAIHPIWQITGMGSQQGWDGISISPSINNHQRGRNWVECDAHFTIAEGLVVYN